MAGEKGTWQARATDIGGIVSGTHPEPFSVLGAHWTGDAWVARCFMPGAERVSVETLDGTSVGTLAPRGSDGFFEGVVSLMARAPLKLLGENAAGRWSLIDPYSFGPVLGERDEHFFAEGTHLRLFDKFGAHATTREGVAGVHFAVWAPSAERVSVVGPFNGWDGRRHPMRRRGTTGVWEIFVPDIAPGTVYKYELLAADGKRLPLKADPYARQAEMRPRTASVVADPTPFAWDDEAYMGARGDRDRRREPVSIYEVHLGSWRRRPDGGFLSYDQLADQLIPYVLDLGFTHIELLPISEHPYDPSWGYQPTGLFAPTSRFGSPDGFKRFVAAAHKAGLGVILDWVPAHFPTDEHGLARFDGTALYEHDDPRQGYHPDWNTAIYNFGRREVSSFLTNNALFWLDEFHIDALRVDAVASMLYLDYSRRPGEWVANQFGGNDNVEAVAFLKRVNAEAYGRHPGTFTIAEESTSWPGVTAPTDADGLGFGFKWNMGFMNDTLRYMQRDPQHRRYHHNDLTFGLLYAFSENFILPLSHDEVVHGKGSLLEKMPGDDWQKFANLRAYYAFMWGYPGKKLLFMGQEFAQRAEWSEARALDWQSLDTASHEGVRRLISDLNAVYTELPALHARDCEPEGFQWLVAGDHANSVLAWARLAPDTSPVVVVSNFTATVRDDYHLPMPAAGKWVERINTDAGWYEGSNQGNRGVVHATTGNDYGFAATARLVLPPLSTLILQHDPG